MESGMMRDIEDLRTILGDQLQEDRDGWVELEAVVDCFEGCERHRIMAHDLLQWSARCVHGLSIEWQAVLQGMSSYSDLYRARYGSI